MKRIVTLLISIALLLAQGTSYAGDLFLEDVISVNEEEILTSGEEIAELETPSVLISAADGEKDSTSFPETTPNHTPVIANINDSIILGLEERLLMTRGTFYKFSVIGAGTDNHNPGEGDTRWVPEYWRIKDGTIIHKNWQVAAVNDIDEEKDIPILVFLTEQKYVNGGWEDTGNEGSIEAAVKTQAIPKRLSAVTGLKAVAEGLSTVNLSWTASSDADGYLILGLNKTKTGTQIGYTAKTSWTDRKADSTGWNYYWVIPFYKNTAGKIVRGLLSNYAYAIGRTIGPVDTLTASATISGIQLYWNEVDNANAYIILSKTGSSKATFDASIVTDKNSYTDAAPTGTVKFYWVYAAYKGENGKPIVVGKVSPFAWAVAK